MNVVPLNQKAAVTAHVFSSNIAEVDTSAVDMTPGSKLRKLIFSCLLHQNEDPQFVAIRLFGRDDPDFLNKSVPNWLADERFSIAKEALRLEYHQKYGRDYFSPSRDEVMHGLVALTNQQSVSAKDKIAALVTVWKMINGKEV